MFKRIILLFLLTSINVFAQTGIGTTTPDASAKLDVTSTNKGFLPPRVTLTSGTDNTTIPSPATGLLVYNTGNNAGLVAGYYYWNGTSWATIATANGSGVSASILRGSRSAAQTGLTNGGNVIFTQVDNTSGQEMSLNTSTGQITLAAGRTYRLLAQVPNYQTSNGDTRLQLAWYNETAGAYVGSSVSSYPPVSGASYGSTGGLSEAVITTTTSTIVSYRITQLSNATQFGGSADFPSAGSYPWFEAQVISGNTAVNGQSVDYVSTSLSNSYSNVGSGYDIVLQQLNGGNIPYNSSTGVYTLTANKTYMMQAQLRVNTASVGNAYLQYTWVDATTNTPLVSNSEALSASSSSGAGYGSKEVVQIIYTPTTNQTIKLRSTGTTGTQSIVMGSAVITQIGSSAIVNPWTLSGTTTYNTLGNVGIGTTSPSASAVLDLTSSTKGFLPPRVALTATNNASPLNSPVTGTVVYNNATTGSFPNQVTPGYYYWNGSIWTRIGNSNIIASNTVTLGAVTTNPTTGTRYMDRTYAVDNGATKRIVVQLGFAGGAIGSGDYLFSLPAGVTFNTASGFNPTYTGNLWAPTIGDMSSYFIPMQGGIVQAGSWNYYGYVIPYSSTQYRIAFPNNGVAGFNIFSSGWYTTNSQTTINLSFDIW
ncbi:MAG: hypothetical protein RL422_14 [Bacteroidota bacterium]|jgi:hypothetical protein